MLITIILLVLGFLLLIKGADFLVDGSSSVAKRFGISNIVIGLTVVAFGTSTPELVVNLLSAFKGTTDIAIGNVLGSNIANIMLILGVTGLISPLVIKKNVVWKDMPFALLSGIVLLFLSIGAFISRIDGIILLAFFGLFMVYIFSSIKNSPKDEDEEIHQYGVGKSTLYIVGGLAFLVLGGKWVVDSAVTLATSWGLSEAVIGLTIVAIGTSLPELVTSVVAAKKGKADIAIGNVIGSNIFNIFWILGLTSVISPLPFSTGSLIDLWVSVGATVLLFVWMFVGKRYVLKRWQSAVFIVLYITYLYVLITMR